VKFTGQVGAAGDTWLTRYRNSLPPGDIFNAFQGMCVTADVLTSKFNNAKGGGVVALLNTDPGDKGLLLLLINNGNTDRLTLNTIDPTTGAIVQLASVPLGTAIVENAWYRVFMDVRARAGAFDDLQVFAFAFQHRDPSDPDSFPISSLGRFLIFTGSLSGLGLEPAGFVGMAAWAKSAVVNTSITNFLASTNCPSG
jgi:hypothetical protein